MPEIDRLLISTFQRVMVREPDGCERVILTKDGPFYGLTWNAEHLFVGARCWGTAGEDALYIFDRDFQLLEKQWLPTFGQQIHQIICLEGIVYILDTLADHVLAWNPATREGQVVVNMGADDPQDIYHFNSIWWHDDLFWLVGLHGNLWFFNRAWNMQGHRAFDFEIHNVYAEDGKLLMGASSLGCLMVEDNWGRRFIDLTEWIGEPCYVRGIARGKYLYVGAALMRERQERIEGSSYIVVFDGETPIQVLRLEDTGGMHGIRVLGLDRAHTNIPW